jgi:hypothetical protein
MGCPLWQRSKGAGGGIDVFLATSHMFCTNTGVLHGSHQVNIYINKILTTMKNKNLRV